MSGKRKSFLVLVLYGWLVGLGFCLFDWLVWVGLVLFVSLFLLFEIGSPYIALAGLEMK